MKNLKLLLLLISFGWFSCIGEDIIDDSVPEDLRFTNTINTLKIGETINLEATYFNNVGEIENRSLSWQSSNTNVLAINTTNSKATAISEGIAILTVTVNGIQGVLTNTKTITVTQNSIVTTSAKKGTFSPTSSYKSAGDFEITTTSKGIKIDLASNYVADTSLPGFALYLTNNPNSLANALQVDAFDDGNGVHFTGAFSYTIDNVGLNDYKYLVQWCRPFSILTGKALIINK